MVPNRRNFLICNTVLLILILSGISPYSMIHDGDVKAANSNGNNISQQSSSLHEVGQRIVLVEAFTALWGQDADDSKRALDMAITDYGSGRVVYIEYHYEVGDPLSIEEGNQRYHSYGIWTIPTVVFDGVDFVVGAPSITEAYQWYGNEIQTHLLEPANVTIQIRSTISTNGLGIIRANVTKAQNLSDADVVLRCAIIEDSIKTDLGLHDNVARMMLPSSAGTFLDLQNNTTDEVTFRFEADPGWNTNNLRCVVWVQAKNQTPIWDGRIHHSSKIHGSSITQFELVANNPPQLQNGSVNPSTIIEGENLEFRVLCSDKDDSRPWSVRVLIRNEYGFEDLRALRDVTSTSNWTLGHWYYWCGTIAVGRYEFRFAAFDGLDLAVGDIGWHSGLWVKKKGPPFDLRNPKYSPTNGTTETVFMFEVEYKHSNNLSPSRSAIIIDGIEHIMDRFSTQADDGWWNYSFQTKLSEGIDHRYYLEFAVQGEVLRFPRGNQTLKGPDIFRKDIPPLLSTASVTPEEGTRLDLFTFKVVYSDPEGTPPSNAIALIDGDKYGMTPKNGLSEDNITFEVTLTLGFGNHEYAFLFSDGINDVRLPGKTIFNGPNVLNLAPITVIDQPRSGSITAGMFINISAAGTFDPEGDDISLVWELDDMGFISEHWSFERSFQEGNYTLTLTATDEHGGTSSTIMALMVLSAEPTIELSALTFSPDGTVAGEVLRIAVKISHVSGGELAGADAILIIDGESVGSQEVNLERKATIAIVFEWKAVEGDHEIILKLLDFSIGQTIYVNPNSRPEVSLQILTPPQEWKTGTPIFIKTSVDDFDGHEVSIQWVIDGEIIEETRGSIEYTFRTGGSHIVSVIARDELGLENSTAMEILVKGVDDTVESWDFIYIVTLVIVVSISIAVLYILSRKRTTDDR